MSTKAQKGCPPDWQQQVLEKKKELLGKGGPLFGLVLPRTWFYELNTYQQELRKLLGVPRVAFEGTSIARMEEPKTE